VAAGEEAGVKKAILRKFEGTVFKGKAEAKTAGTGVKKKSQERPSWLGRTSEGYRLVFSGIQI